MNKEQPRSRKFDRATYAWKPDIDYRQRPEFYRVGRGEQGVLICEPYKIELSPHWRFQTPAMAKASSRILYGMFRDYLQAGDFVGADMARKYLQMGCTRARRYANYKGGRKYDESGALKTRGTGDSEKAESARIFHERWKQAEAEPRYAAQKLAWKARYG
jgi:hypothetical protein